MVERKSLTAVYLEPELKRAIRVYCAKNDLKIQKFYKEALKDRLKKKESV